MDINKARELIKAGKVVVKGFEELKVRENRDVSKNMRAFDFEDDEDGFNRLVCALPFLCKFDGTAQTMDVVLEFTMQEINELMEVGFKKKEI